MFSFLAYGDWIGYLLILIGLTSYTPKRTWTWFLQISGYLVLMGFGYWYHHFGMVIFGLLFALIYTYAYTKQVDINKKLKEIFEDVTK